MQTAETIVPHTIEEAFEVADAVASGGEGLADELGDLLFQSVFLAQLLEEDEGGADLGRRSRAARRDKLIGRHPHVYGDAVAESAAGVVDVGSGASARSAPTRGCSTSCPAGLPALAYATKVQKRAAAVGFDFPDVAAALGQARRGGRRAARATPGARELGDVLFAAVGAARAVGADPELALRASAQRFRARVERAARLAAAAGERLRPLWHPTGSCSWYEEARGMITRTDEWRALAAHAATVERARTCASSSRTTPPAARS